MGINYFVSLKAANAENQRLNTALLALAAEHETAKAALLERDTAAETCRVQFDAKLADLTDKLTAASAQVATLTAAAQTTGQQAAEVIAAQGVAPAKLPGSGAQSQPHTAAELATKIRSETNPSARAQLFAQLQTVWNSKQ